MQRKIKVIEYDTVGSTNTAAKEYATQTDSLESVLFTAREQSLGRGRLGRSFLSRGGKGIYMSLLYYTDEELSDAVSVTTAAAVFAAEEIERATGRQMRIKWVNDIYDERGKVAGILTETMSVKEKNAVIVGIGINTGECDFPRELSGIASSIGKIDEVSRGEIIDGIVSSLLRHAASPQNKEYMTDYRKRFMLDGAHVDLVRAGEITDSGVVKGVCDDGGLIFLPDGGTDTEVIHSGEVSVRNIKK